MRNSPTLYGPIDFDVTSPNEGTVVMNATFTRYGRLGRLGMAKGVASASVTLCWLWHTAVCCCRGCPRPPSPLSLLCRRSEVNPPISVTLKGLLQSQQLSSAALSGKATWVQQKPSNNMVVLQTSCGVGEACAFTVTGTLA